MILNSRHCGEGILKQWNVYTPQQVENNRKITNIYHIHVYAWTDLFSLQLPTLSK